MNVYEFDDHVKFLQNWITLQPRNGFGISKKFAEIAQISPVLMSQILNGSREISPEQAMRLSEYMQLSELEQKYFLNLVHYRRAGSHELKNFYKKEIQKLQKDAAALGTQAPKDIELDEKTQAEFYSHWHYSAIRLLTSIEEFQTPEALASYLEMPRPEIMKALDFLLKHGLCLYAKGKYQIGPQRTHLDATSAYVLPRQIQWRLKGFEKMNYQNTDDLFYTAPLTISKVDYGKVRKLFLKFVQDLTQTVVESGAEELICVNFDLFNLKKPTPQK